MLHLTSGIALVVEVGLAVFCFVDVILAPEDAVRWAPRWAWALALLTFPMVGAILWLCAGRPWRARVRAAGASEDVGDGSKVAARPQPRSNRPGGGGPPRRTPPRSPQVVRLPLPGPSPEATLAEALFAVHEEHERTLQAWESDLRRREAALAQTQRPTPTPQ